MDSGLYAAYTGLVARTQALDTAANNLANAGTNGFRSERDYFGRVMVDAAERGASGMSASQVGRAVNGFGVLGGNALDMGQGGMTPTGNPLDLALEGKGFFAVQTGQGVRYTRDGSFTVSAVGVLSTARGGGGGPGHAGQDHHRAYGGGNGGRGRESVGGDGERKCDCRPCRSL